MNWVSMYERICTKKSTKTPKSEMKMLHKLTYKAVTRAISKKGFAQD